MRTAVKTRRAATPDRVRELPEAMRAAAGTQLEALSPALDLLRAYSDSFADPD